ACDGGGWLAVWRLIRNRSASCEGRSIAMNVYHAIRGTVGVTLIILVTSVHASDSADRVRGGTPGATAQVGPQLMPGFTPAPFTDSNSGQKYSVAVFGTETGCGVGSVLFALSDAFTSNDPRPGDGVIGLGDGRLSFCSTLGPTAQVGVKNGVLFGSRAGAEGAGTTCGEAPSQVVAISSHGSACQADVTLHVFAHINAPYPPFVGNLTVDLHVERQPRKPERLDVRQGAAASISVTIHTFTGKIVLSGPLSGPVAIGTCS